MEMLRANTPPAVPRADWPWDWNFRENKAYDRGRSLKRQSSSSSLLSDCLSQASRQHEQDASFSRSSSISHYSTRDASVSDHLRSPSVSRPGEIWAPSSAMEMSSDAEMSETTSLSLIDMWRSEIPGRGWAALEPSTSLNLVCPSCSKTVKTTAELKKHEWRHKKPFVCEVAGCTRKEGFSTANDLDRHVRSKHPLAQDESQSTGPHTSYRCVVYGCKSNGKTWPRLDNFRSHLKRVHSNVLSNEKDYEDMIKRGAFLRGFIPAEGHKTSTATAAPCAAHSAPSAKDPVETAITQVIISALVGVEATEFASVHSSSSVALNKAKTNDIRSSTSNSGMMDEKGADVSAVSMGNNLSSPSSEDIFPQTAPTGSPTASAEQRAKEVLQSFRELGYLVRKDQAWKPGSPNPRGPSSNKTENLVTCAICHRFKGRPCELKKHMKRHERPYGCTFLTCSKTFGSKNDWKRHENSQHFHSEMWRCDEPSGRGPCAKVCYRRQDFRDHISREHGIMNEEIFRQKIEGCRIGKNCQKRFWCGFCRILVDLRSTGVDAWTERFDHIDDHFMGRNGNAKRGIENWIPADIQSPQQVVTQEEGAEEVKESLPIDDSLQEQRARKRKFAL